ncbi:arsenate reductase [Aquimarina addita]|uniref:Arsenate reductase n=1 Tax=Aquimarina addita TaxID=870485 RepID=A0ABP7XBM8_9FLAO
MKKIYHLSTCDTCKRILKELNPPADYTLQDIKKNPVTQDELQEMYDRSQSYEALFSKRAQLYKKRGLKTQKLTEEDYKNLLLEHYTFLKRPVILINDQIFIGNAQKTVEAAKNEL